MEFINTHSSRLDVTELWERDRVEWTSKVSGQGCNAGKKIFKLPQVNLMFVDFIKIKTLLLTKVLPLTFLLVELLKHRWERWGWCGGEDIFSFFVIKD